MRVELKRARFLGDRTRYRERIEKARAGWRRRRQTGLDRRVAELPGRRPGGLGRSRGAVARPPRVDRPLHRLAHRGAHRRRNGKRGSEPGHRSAARVGGVIGPNPRSNPTSRSRRRRALNRSGSSSHPDWPHEEEVTFRIPRSSPRCPSLAWPFRNWSSRPSGRCPHLVGAAKRSDRPGVRHGERHRARIQAELPDQRSSHQGRGRRAAASAAANLAPGNSGNDWACSPRWSRPTSAAIAPRRRPSDLAYPARSWVAGAASRRRCGPIGGADWEPIRHHSRRTDRRRPDPGQEHPGRRPAAGHALPLTQRTSTDDPIEPEQSKNP